MFAGNSDSTHAKECSPDIMRIIILCDFDFKAQPEG